MRPAAWVLAALLASVAVLVAVELGKGALHEPDDAALQLAEQRGTYVHGAGDGCRRQHRNGHLQLDHRHRAAEQRVAVAPDERRLRRVGRGRERSRQRVHERELGA